MDPRACHAVTCAALRLSELVQHLSMPMEPCLKPWCCLQVPARLEQVLLEWEGGNRELLVRVTDAAGAWLCHKEVHSKLCSSISRQTWHRHTHGEGEPP